MEFRSDVRPSPIAGRWYAGDPVALAGHVDEFVQAARIKKDDLSGKVVGLVVPHAGYIYSGKTAAYAYKTVADQARKLVVILSPLHQYYPGDFITTAFRAYQTPLGDIEVAQKEMSQLDTLLNNDSLVLTQLADEAEHSLEIQLPFLQVIWKDAFQLMPVMVRTYEAGKLKKFAATLAEVIKGKDYLVIASSDLSHFFPQHIAEQLDAGTLRNIGRFDPDRVLAGARDESAPACGAAGITAMLETLKLLGADKVQILNYSNSAAASGDDTSVVGYGAAAVLMSD
jgi:MEMO1 family protein